MTSADDGSALVGVFRALAFAADRHRDQKRKGAGSPPFINHPIDVVAILATVGGVRDPITLQAAVLHDTIEDTATTRAELAAEFGEEVAAVVVEVTDERNLTRDERKRRQVEGAPGLSDRARLVRLADKIANVRAIERSPPVDWSMERRRDYLDWSERVIAGCRGCSEPLERLFDEALRAGLSSLDAASREAT